VSFYSRSIPAILVVAAACGHAMSLSETPNASCDVVWDSVFNVTTNSASQYLAYGAQHSLAVDTFGNVHVVWYDYRSSPCQIGYRRYDRAAGLWLPETILTNNSSACCHPAVACGASGDVHVAWYTSAGIWCKRLDAVTGTWQPETLLYRSESTLTQGYPSLASRPGGDNIHLAWQGIVAPGGAYKVLHQEFEPGAGWSAVSDLGAGTSPSVAVDGRDGVHVAWDNSGPCLRQRIGGTWQPAERFSTASSYHVAVAVDTAGAVVHAAWQGETETSDENEILYQCRTDSGWSSLVHVSQEPEHDQYYASISCAPDGRCEVVWEGEDGSSGGHERIYHAMRFCPGTWTRPEPLTQSSLDASYPCVVHDLNCGLHLVWNDSRTGNRDVRYLHGGQYQYDISPLAIVSPPEFALPSQAFVPEVTVGNQGFAGPAEFRAYLRLDSSGVVVYLDSTDVVGLASGHTQNVTFREWTAGGGPAYQLTVWVAMAGDEDPRNDTLYGVDSVVSWSGGWQQATRTLGAVKRGGWMTGVAGNGLIYLTEGDERDFQSFDALSDSWVARMHFPYGAEGKLPKKGSKGITDRGRYIYATKGNNSTGFWSYDVVTDSWHALAGVPLGSTNKKVKGGADVEYVVLNDTGYVYLLKGYKNEFWRYSTRSGQWEQRQLTPLGQSIRWGEGSWLVYDGDHTLYAHKARFHELWSYNVLTDSWSPRQLRGMPFASRTGKTKKSRDGGSGVWYDGAIYALKGGGTQEFWRYAPSRDSWAELDTLPRGVNKKRVRHGGDLVSFGHDAFFACKGGKTREIWRYLLRADLRMPDPGQRPEVAADCLATAIAQPARPIVPTIVRGVL
jgi:hypothetical protein